LAKPAIQHRFSRALMTGWESQFSGSWAGSFFHYAKWL